MCGLAGFSGITDAMARAKLVAALGIGIDRRGGHAAGFISLVNHTTAAGLRLSKRVGKWSESSRKFHAAASSGEVCLMHARFATCGSRDDSNHAHPFVPFRNGKPVLYGMHNGIVYGTQASAKANGRDPDVDSREVLELLADGKTEDIGKLNGYGVLTWVKPDSGSVYMVRLSKNSDFFLEYVAEGGVVWGSTWDIVKDAMKLAGLTHGATIKVEDVGKVYAITPTGVTVADHPSVLVNQSARMTDYYSSAGGMYDYSGDSIAYMTAKRDSREYLGFGVNRPKRWDESSPEVGMVSSILPAMPGDNVIDARGITWRRTAGYDWVVKSIPQKVDHPLKPERSVPTREEWFNGMKYQDSPPVGDVRYVGNDMYVRTKNAGWQLYHEPSPVVSDLAPAQTQGPDSEGPDSDTGPASRRIHGLLLEAECGDCDAIITPSTERVFSAPTLPAPRNMTYDQLNTMSEEECDDITDAEWDIMADNFIGEWRDRGKVGT